MAPWYRSAYARAVVDMHITDHDPRFLSEFDPARYMEMLKRAGVDSAVVYAHSHVGLCYFPTAIGKTHPSFAGTTHLAEVIDGCHRAGIAVVLYLSAIYDTWAYKSHPEWRMADSNGNEAAANSRYGICCPNSPYRDHIAALAREVCELYRFEGIRFDMTFWPRVCYCRHCAARYEEEVGGDLPKVIDWHDPRWVGFQRKREEWLIEFAHHLTGTVRAHAPGATVEHQSSTFPLNWIFGVTSRLADACDFLQGDFYGDSLQGSFVRKLFRSLSPDQPYGFETSVGIDLQNYTSLKSPDLLRTKAAAATADHGAFIFIDSIDPLGTLNERVYEMMGEVFPTVKPYAEHLGGELVADVGIYLSTESKCDFADNGRPVDGAPLSGSAPHVEAALGVARCLMENHIPYGVITKRSIHRLSEFPLIALPNVLMLGEWDEVEALRAYVHAGGHLYASGWTSLVTSDGHVRDDFMLGDVLGVRSRGRTTERFTYMAPADDSGAVLPGYTRRYPLGVADRQFVVEPLQGATVLARLTLPYTDPDDPAHFASIHNNPPGRWTEDPSIVLNTYGKGRALYCAASIERFAEHGEALAGVLRALGLRATIEADAPPCVEIALARQTERGRYVLSLVNFQKQFPMVPVRDVRVRVRVPEAVRRAELLPRSEPLALSCGGDVAEFTVPVVGTLAMVALQW